MAEKLVSGDRCTARAVCRHFGLNRSTYAYRAKEADAWEAKLKGALRRKSNEHPELGYAKITRLLKQEGWQVGARNVQRLRRELMYPRDRWGRTWLYFHLQSSITTRASVRVHNSSRFRHSSLSRALKLSMYPFCHGHECTPLQYRAF